MRPTSTLTAGVNPPFPSGNTVSVYFRQWFCVPKEGLKQAKQKRNAQYDELRTVPSCLLSRYLSSCPSFQILTECSLLSIMMRIIKLGPLTLRDFAFLQSVTCHVSHALSRNLASDLNSTTSSTTVTVVGQCTSKATRTCCSLHSSSVA